VIAVRVLLVGAGVIGTVYGAHLAAAGHTVSVLSHPPRTDDVAVTGLLARDLDDGQVTQASVRIVPHVAVARFDLVLVAVRSDQFAAACTSLSALCGQPTVLFVGNNPAGRAATDGRFPGEVRLGFPGVGGVLRDGTADYVRIRQQPTALEEAADSQVDEFELALRGRGFRVQRVSDMDGWLIHHAAFVACVAAALYHCGTDPARLAADRVTLKLMCTAVTEAFAALRRAGTGGQPGNLALLHSPLLRPLAVRYWAATTPGPRCATWRPRSHGAWPERPGPVSYGGC
jgi:2-dehydropantoate 2-reductase